MSKSNDNFDCRHQPNNRQRPRHQQSTRNGNQSIELNSSTQSHRQQQNNHNANSRNHSTNTHHQQQQRIPFSQFRHIGHALRPKDTSLLCPPNDNSYNHWRPRLREKPNAVVPLDEVIIKGLNIYEPDRSRPHHHRSPYPHPYAHELNNFSYTPQQMRLEVITPHNSTNGDSNANTVNHSSLFDGVTVSVMQTVASMPPSLADTPLHTVDTLDRLTFMLDKLSKVTSFAVDLEHHNDHSYLGFTCWMQISTRDDDYLVDTIRLRDVLHVLNHVFTNPAITKVFHGAECDIIWLQRDLGVYVVNMFDTAIAAQLLKEPLSGLGALLGKYCNLTTNKSLARFDWSNRSKMTEKHYQYLRSDTHYLLYLYEVFSTMLIEASALASNSCWDWKTLRHEAGIRIEGVCDTVKYYSSLPKIVRPAPVKPKKPSTDTDGTTASDDVSESVSEGNDVGIEVAEADGMVDEAVDKTTRNDRDGLMDDEEKTTTNDGVDVDQTGQVDSPSNPVQPQVPFTVYPYLLAVVLNRSTRCCLKVFSKLNAPATHNNTLRSDLIARISMWKDYTARVNDVGFGRVITKKALSNVVTKLPLTQEALLNCAAPASELLVNDVATVFQHVQDAIAQYPQEYQAIRLKEQAAAKQALEKKQSDVEK